MGTRVAKKGMITTARSSCVNTGAIELDDHGAFGGDVGANPPSRDVARVGLRELGPESRVLGKRPRERDERDQPGRRGGRGTRRAITEARPDPGGGFEEGERRAQEEDGNRHEHVALLGPP